MGKIAWRREWQPTLEFLPREFHEQRSPAGCSPWGCEESDTNERLTHTHTHTHTHFISRVQEKELDKVIKENEGSLRKIQNFYLDQAQRVLQLTPKPQEIHTAA